jgi:amidase
MIRVDGRCLPCYTATISSILFNVTGSPVIVLPLAQSQEGLPLGVQVVEHCWRDMELFSIAEGLTEITGPLYCPQGVWSRQK